MVETFIYARTGLPVVAVGTDSPSRSLASPIPEPAVLTENKSRLQLQGLICSIIFGNTNEGYFAAGTLRAIALSQNSGHSFQTGNTEVYYGGIPLNEYLNLFSGLDNALSSNDRGIRALSFMQRSGWNTPVEALREKMGQHPEVFLLYTIDTTARVIQLKNAFPQEQIFAQLENIVDTMRGANVGIGAAPENSLIYLHINNALALLRDIQFSAAYPGIFALSNEVVQQITGLEWSERFNNSQVTDYILQKLKLAGILDLGQYSQGAIDVRGNIKPVSATFGDALKDPKTYKDVMLVLEAIFGKSFLIDLPELIFAFPGQLSDLERAQLAEFAMVRHTTAAFEKAIQLLHVHQLSDHQEELVRLTIELQKSMGEVYDIQRGRIDVASPDIYNNITHQLEAVIMRLPGAEGYIRASVYSPDLTNRQKVIQAEYGIDPYKWMISKYLGLSKEQLAYLAYHAHLPGFELQVAMKAFRPMLDLLERAYKHPSQTFRGAGIREQEVLAAKRIVDKNLRQI